MQKWEYRMLSWELTHTWETIEHYLNTAGSDGWRVAQSWFKNGYFFALMEREKKEEKPDHGKGWM